MAEMPRQARHDRLIHFFTCSVEDTSRTPSVSKASIIALPMSWGEETFPDNVTRPSVVFTEIPHAESSLSSAYFALIFAVIAVSAPASATAVPKSRIWRRTTLPVFVNSC